ncbi:hypothetical protein Trydic_g3742 [Trypoxylus dichotomus]
MRPLPSCGNLRCGFAGRGRALTNILVAHQRQRLDIARVLLLSVGSVFLFCAVGYLSSVLAFYVYLTEFGLLRSHPFDIRFTFCTSSVRFCCKVQVPYCKKKASNESINDWAARVRSLAMHCEFGQELDVSLRDRFIMGLPRGPVLGRLLEENDTITLADAMKIASNNNAVT